MADAQIRQAERVGDVERALMLRGRGGDVLAAAEFMLPSDLRPACARWLASIDTFYAQHDYAFAVAYGYWSLRLADLLACGATDASSAQQAVLQLGERLIYIGRSGPGWSAFVVGGASHHEPTLPALCRWLRSTFALD